MFYISIKRVLNSNGIPLKEPVYEYMHQDGRGTPYLGGFDNAIGFELVDDAVNWFGRMRKYIDTDINSRYYDRDSLFVQKISFRNKLQLR